MGRDKETHNRVSDIMSDDISSLKEQVAALSAECAELRTMVAQMSADMTAASGAAGEAATHPQPEPDAAPHLGEFPPRRPFDIWYDPVQEEWKIYIPDGCVMVGDAEAEYKHGKSNDVATIEPAGKVYCHVSAKSDSPGEYEYEFSESSANNNAAYSFPVATFSDALSEVAAQHVIGCVHLESVARKRYAVDKDDEKPSVMIDASAQDSASVEACAGGGNATLNANDGNASMELGCGPDGGHSVILQTSDATQDDVKIRECIYYAPGSITPTKVNVVASQVMTIRAAAHLNVVTGLSFAISNGKLQCTPVMNNSVTGEQVQNVQPVDVCDVHSLNVLIDTDYTNPNFTQQKQTVTVIGAAPSAGEIPAPETVFTTTPLSSELVS